MAPVQEDGRQRPLWHNTQTQTPLREVDQKGDIHGQVTVSSGHKDEQSLYRGELGGILSSVIYKNNVCKQHDITTENA